jgi:hypothetical protein
MLVPILVGSGGRNGAQVSATSDGRPAWPVVSAWALWLLTILTLAAVPLLDSHYEALGGPFDLRGHGGVLLLAN